METTLETLIERFRSKPEWQHADPAVRADAVLRLPSSEREVLLALAREDADPRVRRAAVKRLPDADVLAGIASSDADPGVRDEAEACLAHLAVHERDESAARDKYNLVLSDKRAQATVNYLISRGIDKNRLTWKGYGESRLLNRCRNKVTCTEEEHQLNRRTEFKVTKIVQGVHSISAK